jgi:hypothetical protein
MKAFVAVVFMATSLLSAPLLAEPSYSGRYAVPVANAELAPFASFEVRVERLQVLDKRVSLEVLLPFELTGAENYRKVFEGEIASDGALVLDGIWAEGEPEVLDRLRCALAPSQETTVCLAQWPTLKREVNEEALREHLLQRNPSMPAAELSARVNVSRAFGGDAIGILEYQIPSRLLGYPN